MSDYDLFEELDKDSRVDETDLDKEVLKIPYLHAKWMKRYVALNRDYRKAQNKTAGLLLERQQYYLGTASDEVYRASPINRKVLKSEVSEWLDADVSLQEAREEEAVLKDVVMAVEKFISSLNNRGFNIKAAIDYLRWKNGG